MSSRKKQIALFGGSFNPPHKGHLEIVRRVAQRKTIDEVWILPVYKHPFGKRMAAFDKRAAVCRRYFAGKKIKIKPYEHRSRSTGYTIDLIHYLRKKFPNDRFWWVMGADAYKERKKWKNFGELKKLVRLIIFQRGPRSTIPHVSSTEIRQMTGPPRGKSRGRVREPV